MSDERVRTLRRMLQAALSLAAELEEEQPSEPPGSRGPGRPRVVPTAEQVAQVLRLRHTNGDLGYRAIGLRVGLSWRPVKRILDEDESASQNPRPTSQNPSPRKSRPARSDRHTGGPEGGDT